MLCKVFHHFLKPRLENQLGNSRRNQAQDIRQQECSVVFFSSSYVIPLCSSHRTCSLFFTFLMTLLKQTTSTWFFNELKTEQTWKNCRNWVEMCTLHVFVLAFKDFLRDAYLCGTIIIEIRERHKVLLFSLSF